MHKQHLGRSRRYKAYLNTDESGDWEDVSAKRKRSKTRRIRRKPYEHFSRSNRSDWFAEIED